MERDFRKFTAWLEEILQVGVAEENKLLEWKLAEKSRPENSKSTSGVPSSELNG
jgi:hypothetical protein